MIEGGPRLHGRDRALRRITELRRCAAEGVGGVVLVAGEAGMGKTAPFDAVLVDAKRDGWQVAWTAAAQGVGPTGAVAVAAAAGRARQR